MTARGHLHAREWWLTSFRLSFQQRSIAAFWPRCCVDTEELCFTSLSLVLSNNQNLVAWYEERQVSGLADSFREDDEVTSVMEHSAIYSLSLSLQLWNLSTFLLFIYIFFHMQCTLDMLRYTWNNGKYNQRERITHFLTYSTSIIYHFRSWRF